MGKIMFDVTCALILLLEFVVVQSAAKPEFCSGTDDSAIWMRNHSTPLAKENKKIQIVIHNLGELDIPLCGATLIAFKDECMYLMCNCSSYDRQRNETMILKTVRVLERNYPFDLLMLLDIEEIKSAFDMFYSEISNSLYVADMLSHCIWKITLDDQQVTKWLEVDSSWLRISKSSDGDILVLRKVNDTIWPLEIYGLDGDLVRSFLLPDFIKTPGNVIQSPDGSFIINHYIHNGSDSKVFITHLTRDGKFISHVNSLDESPILQFAFHMMLDPNPDLLFLTDLIRVIFIDSTSLSWSQVIATEFYLLSLYYDARRRLLFVRGLFVKIYIFLISHST